MPASRYPSPIETLPEEVQAALTVAGIDDFVDFDGAYPGLFTFGGVITDNATTVADLTLGTANYNKQLREVFGTGNDPEMVMAIDAIKLELENQGESDAMTVLADLYEQLYLHHARDNKHRYIDLQAVVGSLFHTPAVADTSTAGANQIRNRYGRPAEWLKLPFPMLIDFKRDVFEVAPRAAVDMAVNVPFQLHVKGCAWSTAKGSPTPARAADRQRATAFMARRQILEKLGEVSMGRASNGRSR